ncbi:hypothetical protein HK102_001732, partial [Quaeritorhiza haematococci]
MRIPVSSLLCAPTPTFTPPHTFYPPILTPSADPIVGAETNQEGQGRFPTDVDRDSSGDCRREDCHVASNCDAGDEDYSDSVDWSEVNPEEEEDGEEQEEEEILESVGELEGNVVETGRHPSSSSSACSSSSFSPSNTSPTTRFAIPSSIPSSPSIPPQSPSLPSNSPSSSISHISTQDLQQQQRLPAKRHKTSTSKQAKHFACTVPGCTKVFTRRFNLDAHLRCHEDTKERGFERETTSLDYASFLLLTPSNNTSILSLLHDFKNPHRLANPQTSAPSPAPTAHPASPANTTSADTSSPSTNDISQKNMDRVRIAGGRFDG